MFDAIRLMAINILALFVFFTCSVLLHFYFFWISYDPMDESWKLDHLIFWGEQR
jgi:hypothetical protein